MRIGINNDWQTGSGALGRNSAFTLAEVVISASIATLVIAGMIQGYVMSSRRAEWSSYSLAAQSLAIQRMEQTRACKWDPEAYPAVDELISANFPAQINTLDIPISGTNIVYATNFTTITSVSTVPPLKMISVDCVWRFAMNGRTFTNSIATYRAPDT